MHLIFTLKCTLGKCLGSNNSDLTMRKASEIQKWGLKNQFGFCNGHTFCQKQLVEIPKRGPSTSPFFLITNNSPKLFF